MLRFHWALQYHHMHHKHTHKHTHAQTQLSVHIRTCCTSWMLRLSLGLDEVILPVPVLLEGTRGFCVCTHAIVCVCLCVHVYVHVYLCVNKRECRMQV